MLFKLATLVACTATHHVEIQDSNIIACAVCVPGWLQILGGSFISTGQLASKYARYQFRPHFFQHATFRLVQSSSADLSLYDTSAASPEAPILPFFETSCMDAAEPYVGDHPCCSKARRER
jgi:hypothetical protein